MKNDNHLPGCAALICRFCGEVRECRQYHEVREGGGWHSFAPMKCDKNCELGRLRAGNAALERIIKEQRDTTLGYEKICKDLRAEVEKWKAEAEKYYGNGIHSCGPHCQRIACVQRRELETLREWQRQALDVIKRCGESEFINGDEFADLTRKLIAEAGQTEGEG